MAAITEIPDSPQDPIPPSGRDAVDTELKNRDEGFLGSLVGSILEVRPPSPYPKVMQDLICS
jgi:hypothetical protein